MKKTFWDKRIPTLLGMLLILLGVGLTSYLARQGTNFWGRASPSETPENIRITNVSDSSFTVSYKTAGSSLGSLTSGIDKGLGGTLIDDRDQKEGTLNPYKIHYFTLRNLKPSTRYFFTIISGQNTFLNNGEPFEVATGPLIEEKPPNQQPIVGKITLENGTSPRETVIYATIPNGQVVSALVKPDGSYILPLNSLRTQDLSSYFVIEKDALLQLLVVGAEGEATAKLKLNQINSVPLITLLKNYDFTIDISPVASISGSLGFPSFSASPSASKNPQILTPKKDESFSDQQPQFRGTAPPGAEIKIIIHSEELQVQVKADSTGNWSYRPQTPLSSGQHSISIETRDTSGIIKKITQSFSVYAQGTQVEQPATPSATPILTITPTPTLLPISSPTPTLAPTATPTLTPTPTLIPPQPTESIKPPGSASGLVVGATFLTTTVLGIILFLITRGGASSL